MTVITIAISVICLSSIINQELIITSHATYSEIETLLFGSLRKHTSRRESRSPVALGMVTGPLQVTGKIGTVTVCN